MPKMKTRRWPLHDNPAVPPGGAPPPAGFIFMCDHVTKPECFRSSLFGLPFSRIESVMRIQPGAALFLLDCELRILYGVYRAASHGGANLVPGAFGGKYPAQVKFQIDRDCRPLPEIVFRNAIQENYSKGRYRPNLDYQQVNRLLSLFSNTAVPAQPRAPINDKYAHQTATATASMDPRYVPSAAPLVPVHNGYHSLVSDGSYSSAPPLQPTRDLYYAAPNSYTSAMPAPPPNNQHYVALTSHVPAPLAPLSNNHHYATLASHAAATPSQLSNNHYYAASAPQSYPAQTTPQSLNGQCYTASSHYPVQPLGAPPHYQHIPEHPNHPAPTPRAPPQAHPYYVTVLNDPYNQRQSTHNYYPGNAIPA